MGQPESPDESRKGNAASSALRSARIAHRARVSPAQAQLRGHGGPVRALAVSPDGTTVVSGSFDTSAIRWSLTRNAAEQVLRFHESAVNAVALAADGRIVTGGEDGTRRRVATGLGRRPRSVLEGHTAPIVGARGVAGRQARRVRIVGPDRSGCGRWPAARRACSKAISRTSTAWRSRRTASRWSARATTSRSASGRSTAARRPIVTLPTPLNSVAVARDGEIVAGGADGRVFFVAPTGELRGELDSGADADHHRRDRRPTARSSPRPASAARSRSSTARTRTLVRTLVGPGLPVWSAAFLPDNRTLVTGGTDRMVRRWNATTGDHIGSVPMAGVERSARGLCRRPRRARCIRACIACHTLTPDEGNRAGPTLAGIFGRRIATLPGYNFSPALKKLDIVWTPETVSKLFEIGPMAYTPGTKMPEQTIGSAEDRDALVQFLEKTTEQR